MLRRIFLRVAALLLASQCLIPLSAGAASIGGSLNLASAISIPVGIALAGVAVNPVTQRIHVTNTETGSVVAIQN